MFDEVKKSLENIHFYYSSYCDVIDPLNKQNFKENHQFLELKGFIDGHIVFLVKKNLDLLDALCYKESIVSIDEFKPDRIRIECLRTGKVQEYENCKKKNK